MTYFIYVSMYPYITLNVCIYIYIFNEIDILHKFIFYILLYFKFEKCIYLSHTVCSV